MKVSLGALGLAFLASIHLVISTPARAQDESPPPINSRALAATIDYGNGAIFNPEKGGTDFNQLGLDPEQKVSVTVQFPVEMAGQAILTEPLDGGLLTLPDGGLIVGADGTVNFQFQAGDFFGSCRIAVHQPDDSNFVRFWIVDSECPANNPPNLEGIY